MPERYKPIINSIVASSENSFQSGISYKFGRKKSLNRIEMMLELTQKHGVPITDATDAMVYMDEAITRNNQLNAEQKTMDDRPVSLADWEDGDMFPEWITPIQMAVLLFTRFEVSTSGTLKFSPTMGVPRWILAVNPGMKVTDRVKEHDVKSGLGEEIRRFRRQRSKEEKEAGHTVSVEEVSTCRDSVTSNSCRLAKEIIAKEIAYDKKIRGKGSKELMSFLKKYNAPETSDHSEKMHMLHFTMICQWLWQVKRRLNGLPTSFQIALIFLGRQGIGKSFATKRIISVIGDLATPANISNLVDERETRRWEKYYVAFLDEVSKESKDSLAKLKDWVTKEESEFRPLYSNSSEACDKNAQAIGTSNFPLTSILKDPSGMRRFWEIPSDQLKNVLFDGMEKIDWKTVYQMIDETNPEGYYGPNSIGKAYYEEIVAIQNSARDKSPVEEYLYMHNNLDINGDVRDDLEKEWVDLGELRDKFNFWSTENAWGEYTPKAFRNELQSMHLPLKRKTGNKLFVELNCPDELKTENEINEKEIGFE